MSMANKKRINIENKKDKENQYINGISKTPIMEFFMVY